MKVEHLEIEGFRGIENIRIDCGSQLTVIVGTNGVGKTSILDAIAILLDNYVTRWVKGNAQGAERIKDTDVNIRSDRTRLLIRVDEDGRRAEWVLRKQGRNERLLRPSSSDLEGLNSFVRRMFDDHNGRLLNSTLCVYYGQRRAVLDVPQRIRSESKQSPEAAFDSALSLGGLNFREFVAWFRDRSLEEAQHWQSNPRHSDRQLSAVRTAIAKATHFGKTVYRISNPSGLCFEKNGVILRVDQLSSGERSFISLVGDLARRLAMLNPYRANPLEGRGVVLIDEIELHLHPNWQRNIIPLLQETFSQCQFVITTHSPQVLGLVHAENIVILRSDGGRISTATPLASYGRDSNFILLSVLEGEERDTQLKSDLLDLDRAITSRNFENAENLLRQLQGRMEGNSPELVLAQARLERARRAIRN